MSGVDFLTTRLSAEVRLLIYDHVFGQEDYAQRSDAAGPLLPISILATCRTIHQEAIEAFYNSKTIRLTVSQSKVALKEDWFTAFARNIQIVRTDHLTSPTTLRRVLRKALRLPRINAVTIMSDSLVYKERAMGAENWRSPFGPFVTVRQFAEDMGLGTATCIDVGRYVLSGQFNRVEILNTKLRRMWPKVASTTDDYDALEAARSLVREWGLKDAAHPVNVMAWVSQTSLQLWIGLLQAICGVPTGAALADELKDFLNCVNWAPYVEKGTSAIPLYRLAPQHDAEALEYWTELLSINLATCRVYISSSVEGDEPDQVHVTPHWCELEGGDPIGKIKGDEIRWERLETVGQAGQQQ